MTPEFDATMALDFLVARFPSLERGERIEIRALDKSKGGLSVARGFFATPAQAVEYVKTLNMGWEVYYGVNPRLGSDGTKAGIARVLVAWADLDFAKQGEREAFAILAAYDLATTWQVHSGNGVHAYWSIEPLDAQQYGPEVERTLRGLYARLGNPDAVQNIDRILRLPGTFNNKYDTPRRVRVIEHTPTNRYTLARVQATIPALPPQERETKGPAGITQPGDADEEEVRGLLRHIDPCLPYREYLAVWMAVHALFPGAAGMQLIDDWSSEARAHSGQYSSPRTQPTKHYEFRRSGGAGAVGMGTLVYYAQLGGYQPPARPTPLIKRKFREAQWRQDLEELGEIDRHRLPYYLERQIDYLGEVVDLLPLDFSVLSALALWGLGVSNIRFENLKPHIWFLGIARSNAGKNVITDGLADIWKRVQIRDEFVAMTSGSPEGMYAQLDGVGKRIFSYHREFAGYLRSFARDYMSTARDAYCNLYDGSDIHHLLAKKVIHAVDPFVVVLATTTPSGISGHMQLEDMQSGYVNRFAVCFADSEDRQVEMRPSPAQAEVLGREIGDHLAALAHLRRAQWDVPTGEVPAIWTALCQSLGVGTGKIYRVEESVDEVQRAVWRELARVKKVATMLESMERNPQIEGYSLIIRESNLRLATQITLRSAAFLRGMETIVNVSADEALMNRIKRVLSDGPLQKSVLRSRCHADIRPFQQALEALEDDGLLTEAPPEDGKRTKRYKLTG